MAEELEETLSPEEAIEELLNKIDDFENDLEEHQNVVNNVIEYLIKTEAKVNALVGLLSDMKMIDLKTLEELAEEEEDELLQQYNQ